MLITELKAKETIKSLVSGKVFIINCHGCKEVWFPEHEAEAFQKELPNVTGIFTTDYICNPNHLKLRLERFAAQIEAADTILVFSCGVGVQTVADHFIRQGIGRCVELENPPPDRVSYVITPLLPSAGSQKMISLFNRELDEFIARLSLR